MEVEDQLTEHGHGELQMPPLDIGSDDLKPVADDAVEAHAVVEYTQLVSRVFNHTHNLAKDAGEDLSGFSYELRHAHKILRDLMSDAHKGVNAPFLTCLDRAQLVDDMDDYRDVIQRPIWLGRIKERLFGNVYETITEVVNEVRLMLENCYRFHGPNSTYTKKGLKLEQILEQKLALLPREIRDKTTLELTYGQACEEVFGIRRRSTRHSLDYTSVILNRVRHERALRDKEQKKKHTEVKKAEKEVKEKEVIEWENTTLLAEPLKTQMRSMWELPLIGHFLFLCQTVLNIHEVSIYELERIFIMPRASSLLPRIMTSLLSNPHQRVNLDRRPAMPYKIWQNRLMGRVQSWYKIRQARDNRADLVFQQLGIEADFFQIMGAENPLLDKRFHELTFHQRVWLVKSLCDYILQSHKSILDTMNEQTMDDLREYVLGSDSDGNAYLHFPQFCGIDLRIYRQSKTTREPAPCRWGAISTNKRELDIGEENLFLNQDVKKLKTESPERISTPFAKPRSESPKPLLNTVSTDSCLESSKPPLPQDKTMPPVASPGLPQLHEDSDNPPTLEDETKQLPFSEEDSSMVDSKTPPTLLNENTVRDDLPRPDEIESSTKKQSKIRSAPQRKAGKPLRNNLLSPVWNTRRNLRLTPARLAILDVDYMENTSSTFSSSSSEDQSEGSDKSWVDDEEEVDESGVNDDEMIIFDESEDEPTCLEPDIKKFELVVDSVEALRKLRDNFSAKLDSVASDAQKGKKSMKVPPKYKCELELRDRLTNLLSELEPWEPKLLKATQRLRLKLKREWEDFNDREEEVDEAIWGSDKESVIDDDSSSANENSLAGDEYRPPSTVPVKPSTKALEIDEDAALLLDGLGEYRTRGRVKQIRNMKLNPGALNGTRQGHDEFIRSHAKHNTVSQAKELYAWETLRQILVPSGTTTQPESSSNVDLKLASSKFPSYQPISERKVISKAELDILGAINAATSMAKRHDSVDTSPKTISVRTYDNIKKLGTPICVPKSGITQPSGFVLHIPTSRISSAQPSSSSNVSAVSAALTSVPQVTPSTSGFHANSRLPDPASVPTKQQLSDLSSIADNTESLREILDVAKKVTVLRNQQASIPGTAVISIKSSDGKSVYQLGASKKDSDELGSSNDLLTDNFVNNSRLIALAPMKTAPKIQINIPENPAKLQQVNTGHQTFLVPVSNHQGQTVYIRVPSDSGTQSPLKVVQTVTANALSTTHSRVSLQPPPLEPIRRLVQFETAVSTTTVSPASARSARCASPRQVCYRPVTTPNSPLRQSSPRSCVTGSVATHTWTVLASPPKLVGFNTTSRNPLPRFPSLVTPSYRHLFAKPGQNQPDLVQTATRIPNPINIPATPVASNNNNNLIASGSVSGVANLTALLSSNRSVAAAIQKLTMSGHKVVISQQANGDVVLHASPQVPTVVGSAISGQPVIAVRPQQQMNSTSTATNVGYNSPIRNVDQTQKLLVNCKVNASSRLLTNAQLPHATHLMTATPNSASHVLLQPLNVTSPTTANIPQEPPKTSTSIKSKLIVITDPNTKKQSFALMLGNGQVLPVNTTLSIANNNNNDSGNVNLNPIG